MSFTSMLNATTEDVPSPLYYIIVQFLYEILGYNDYVYYLSSVIPYLLTLIVALTAVRKKWGMKLLLY